MRDNSRMRLEKRVRERCASYIRAHYQHFDCDIRTEPPAPDPAFGGGLTERWLTSATEAQLKDVDDALNDRWRADSWESRISPFLDRLTLHAGHDALPVFRWLINSGGCQPDILAEAFYRAVEKRPKVSSAELSALEEAESLAAAGAELEERANSFIRYIRAHSLCTAAPENLAARINPVAKMLGDIAQTHRRNASSAVPPGELRRTWLLGALQHIDDVTGRPRHADALTVINALRVAADQDLIESDTLSSWVKRARRGRDERHEAFRRDVERLDGDGFPSFESGERIVE
jgi:hypothetical protein